jgi:hypothetical protein
MFRDHTDSRDEHARKPRNMTLNDDPCCCVVQGQASLGEQVTFPEPHKFRYGSSHRRDGALDPMDLEVQ